MHSKNVIKYPTISVVIPTFNSGITIDECLSGIRNQDYPQDNIEIIIVDGGSVDGTKKIAKKYKVKWFNANPKDQNVEGNKSIGIQKAKNELLFMIDHDNFLTNKFLLKNMVKPFLDIEEMVGVGTMRYTYDEKFTLLDRYFALFGVNDPLAYYIGKADRMSYIKDGYAKKYNPIDYKDYYLVRFEEDMIPTIGANGFLLRRILLIRYADLKPGKYFPIDVNVDLIKKGFNTYAFIKGSIVHQSGRGGVKNYLNRRILFLRQYHLSEDNLRLQKNRRYSLYERKDFWRLVYFIFISMTFVVPLIDSLRGYIKIRDKAWFLNPIMCFGFVVIYGFAITEHQIKIVVKKL